MGYGRVLAAGILGACLGVLQPSPGWAQAPKRVAAPAAKAAEPAEEPDAQRTKQELSQLLDHYPPTLRNVLALDPSLLGNSSYLEPYPDLVSFLAAHPEITRAPSFYIEERNRQPQDRNSQELYLWKDVFNAVSIFAGFLLAAGLTIWLIHTLVDWRRWSRLARVQTEVHNKLLDRFTANEDLLAYIQSPAGSRFLESTPIRLDSGPRNIGAPFGRILWSLQGGLVLTAGGVGLEIVGGRFRSEVSQPLDALGILAIALGVGFVISAIISYVISQRLGLIEAPAPPVQRAEPPVA